MSGNLRRRIQALEEAPARPPITDPREMTDAQILRGLMEAGMLLEIRKDQRRPFEDAINRLIGRGDEYKDNPTLAAIIEASLAITKSGQPGEIDPGLVQRFIDAGAAWWDGVASVVEDVP